MTVSGDGKSRDEPYAASVDDPVLSLEQQMSNVQIIARLWWHYFVEDHPGDFADCTDPSCAPFTDEVRNARA